MTFQELLKKHLSPTDFQRMQDFMASMDLTQFAVPLSAEASTGRMIEKWSQISSDAALRGLVHQRALYWKRKQQQFYRKLALDLSA